MDALNYSRHYLSGRYGDLPEDEYETLKSNISDNGFIDPNITLFEGEILDGWHRYRVATELGIVGELNFTEIDSEDPASIAIGKNLTRRHLNKTVGAIIVAESYHWNNGSGEKRKQQLLQNSLTLVTKTDKEMARLAGCSLGALVNAKNIIIGGLSNQVKSGDMTILEATEKIKKDAEKVALEAKKKSAAEKLEEQNRLLEAKRNARDLAQQTKERMEQLNIDEEELVSFVNENLAAAEEELEEEVEVLEEAEKQVKEAKRESDLKIGTEESDIRKIVTISRQDLEGIDFNIISNGDYDKLSQVSLMDIDRISEFFKSKIGRISKNDGLTVLQKHIINVISSNSEKALQDLRSLVDSKLDEELE